MEVGEQYLQFQSTSLKIFTNLKRKTRGVLVSQSVKCRTLDLGLGLDLTLNCIKRAKSKCKCKARFNVSIFFSICHSSFFQLLQGLASRSSQQAGISHIWGTGCQRGVIGRLSKGLRAHILFLFATFCIRQHSGPQKCKGECGAVPAFK